MAINGFVTTPSFGTLFKAGPAPQTAAEKSRELICGKETAVNELWTKRTVTCNHSKIAEFFRLHFGTTYTEAKKADVKIRTFTKEFDSAVAKVVDTAAKRTFFGTNLTQKEAKRGEANQVALDNLARLLTSQGNIKDGLQNTLEVLVPQLMGKGIFNPEALELPVLHNVFLPTQYAINVLKLELGGYMTVAFDKAFYNKIDAFKDTPVDKLTQALVDATLSDLASMRNISDRSLNRFNTQYLNELKTSFLSKSGNKEAVEKAVEAATDFDSVVNKDALALAKADVIRADAERTALIAELEGPRGANGKIHAAFVASQAAKTALESVKADGEIVARELGLNDGIVAALVTTPDLPPEQKAKLNAAMATLVAANKTVSDTKAELDRLMAVLKAKKDEQKDSSRVTPEGVELRFKDEARARAAFLNDFITPAAVGV